MSNLLVYIEPQRLINKLKRELLPKDQYYYIGFSIFPLENKTVSYDGTLPSVNIIKTMDKIIVFNAERTPEEQLVNIAHNMNDNCCCKMFISDMTRFKDLNKQMASLLLRNNYDKR